MVFPTGLVECRGPVGPPVTAMRAPVRKAGESQAQTPLPPFRQDTQVKQIKATTYSAQTLHGLITEMSKTLPTSKMVHNLISKLGWFGL